MTGKSKIEWTEQTWNPIVGCSIVSPGCTNCYAMKMASRIEAMGNQPRYAGTTRKVKGNAIWTGKLAQAPESALLAPLRWKKPTVYFVNSMGDLFHEDCPDEWIDRVFAVMALCPRHTFQVLTKRAARMRKYFSTPGRVNQINGAKWSLLGTPIGSKIEHGGKWMTPALPLSNVWLGVSTERQQEADERIPLLLKTPAAVHFISAEPLLGPIDLVNLPSESGMGRFLDALNNGGCKFSDIPHKLDWVIVGGESGPDARPMHPDWARSLRDQCEAAGMLDRFFFKQWGCWAPGECADKPMTRSERCATWFGEKWDFETVTSSVSQATHRDDEPDVYWLGKKGAGRLLDGIKHNGMPELQ